MNTRAIKIIAVLIVLPGFYYFFSNYHSYYHMMLSLYFGKSPFKNMPVWSLCLYVAINSLNLLRIISGFGLYRLRRWGWMLSVWVLSADILLRMSGLVNRLVYYGRGPEAKLFPKGLWKAFIKGGAVDGKFVSMAPSYLILLLSLVLLFILIKAGKDKFPAKRAAI